jgi:hypothetical protein
MPPRYQLRVVGFARAAVEKKLPYSPGFDGSKADRSGARSSGALVLAQRLNPADSPGRIWLLTDGVPTRAIPARAFAESARAAYRSNTAICPRPRRTTSPSPGSIRR